MRIHDTHLQEQVTGTHVVSRVWAWCSGREATWAARTGRRECRALSVLLRGDRCAPALQLFSVAGLIGLMKSESIIDLVGAASRHVLGQDVRTLASLNM
jgi:hypothetical protein